MGGNSHNGIRSRRVASMLVGSLAILALAAAPAMAHTTNAPSDSARHVLLAAELVGADGTDAIDLESLLDAEDGTDQVASVDEVAGPIDGGQQADQSGNNQAGPDETDGANNNDQSGNTETDSVDSGAGGGAGGSSSDSGGNGSQDGGGTGGD